MKIDLEIDSIKQKLFERLEPSGWGKVFKSYIFSSEFEDTLSKLYAMSISGKRFTPPLKDVFRAFEECPYNELKLVIVGQDPYPHLDQADGIAFSCSKTGKLQPSLRYVFDEINNVYETKIKLSEFLKLFCKAQSIPYFVEVKKEIDMPYTGAHMQLKNSGAYIEGIEKGLTQWSKSFTLQDV